MIRTNISHKARLSLNKQESNLDINSTMETYYVIRQNVSGHYLLNKPNKILFSTKNKKEAEMYFNSLVGSDRVFPDEFDKGIYKLVSIGHYPLHPKALLEINSNVYPV